MIKKHGWLIYIIVVGSALIAVIGNGLYREASILPPTIPENLEELADWSEDDLWRLMKYYDCDESPSVNIPDDLKEFAAFCNTVYDYWNKKYDEGKLDGAREGAKRLKSDRWK